MKLKELSREELESMSYDDIAYQIFVEENKKLKLPDLFKKICKLLDLDDAEYENRIGDFFQLISRDQRFKMLEKGYWDLKEKYQTQIIIDNDEEELSAEESEEDLDMNEPEDETENDSYYDDDSEDDDPEEDDLKDLVIISDDEEDEANLS